MAMKLKGCGGVGVREGASEGGVGVQQQCMSMGGQISGRGTRRHGSVRAQATTQRPAHCPEITSGPQPEPAIRRHPARAGLPLVRRGWVAHLKRKEAALEFLFTQLRASRRYPTARDSLSGSLYFVASCCIQVACTKIKKDMLHLVGGN